MGNRLVTYLVLAGVVGLSFSILVAFAYFRYSGAGQKLICESVTGGRWAGAGDICISRSCFQNSSCGHWRNAGFMVDHVKPGDSIADVYFWLGQPDLVNGDSHYWEFGKPETYCLKATLREGKLVNVVPPDMVDMWKFSCGKT